MKTLILSSSIALMLLSSAAAFAAPRHDGQDGRWQQVRGHDTRNDNDRPNQRWAQNRGHDNGRHLGERRQAFRRGEHVPTVYLQQQYYVRDYRSYHLAPPPRGYRWVRPADGHYLLIASATGLISQLLGY
jgi:Ni/Co efflux regulator RcnB